MNLSQSLVIFGIGLIANLAIVIAQNLPSPFNKKVLSVMLKVSDLVILAGIIFTILNTVRGQNPFTNTIFACITMGISLFVFYISRQAVQLDTEIKNEAKKQKEGNQ